jgi:hypothetical protein
MTTTAFSECFSYYYDKSLIKKKIITIETIVLKAAATNSLLISRCFKKLLQLTQRNRQLTQFHEAS